MDIEKWLRGLELQQYAVTFRDNAIDAEILPELTDVDLEKLGVVLGHRKRLLKAIAALAAPVAATQATSVGSAPSHGHDAERRQLTVMFCDLVGSTALSARLDPEDMREIVGAYHRCCADLITKAGGFVARYMGDGVLAYFGYPQAHEHDAERAVRAGLALVEAVPKLKTAASAPLQVRVGIATGLVVVGDLIGDGSCPGAGGGRRDAEPGRPAASAGRAGRGGDLIEHTQADRRPLRLPRSRAQSRSKASPRPSRHGRRWARAPPRAGSRRCARARRRSSGAARRSICSCAAGSRRRAARARVVLLSGEPGIGKSRIAETILERLSGEPHTRLRQFCSPHHQDTRALPEHHAARTGGRVPARRHGRATADQARGGARPGGQ